MSESSCPPPSYESFGDARPSIEELRAIVAFEPSWQELAAYSIVRSEAYLDLTVLQPERAGRWVKRSRDSLTRVSKLAQTAKRKGGRKKERFWGMAHLLATAHLRRPELENWKRAVKGEPLENNYEELLETALDTLPLLDPAGREDDLVQARLIEVTPLLLFARGVEGEPEVSGLGRLALSREERRTELPAEDINPNWDAGIVFGTDPGQFIDPTFRLSVKALFNRRGGSSLRQRVRNKPQSYRNAGIIPVSAAHFGFDNPRQVILSCVDEYEDVSPEALMGATLLSSDQLDEMTVALKAFITGPSEDQN